MKVEMENDSIRLFPHSDKVIHFTMFLVLACTLALAFVQNNFFQLSLKNVWLTLIACACYGALLEYLQGTSWVNRDCDVWDWAADVLGCLCGIALSKAYLLHRIGSAR